MIAKINTIWFATLLCLLGAAFQRSGAEDREIPQSDTRLQTLYQQDAKRWEMWVDPDQKRKAEIVAEPVFRWQNLSRANGQSGAMFVWVEGGRPVVIGGVFSNPENDRRVIYHGPLICESDNSCRSPYKQRTQSFNGWVLRRYANRLRTCSSVSSFNWPSGISDFF